VLAQPLEDHAVERDLFLAAAVHHDLEVARALLNRPPESALRSAFHRSQ
jgi:hypothetical protein